ncbi:MAG: hypothetical protein ACTHY8_09940 [Microbacterium gubbeenense]|uniref:hypothetical protein n=1 Tax=Microbacterium gubbeenense TaxID=159896 RepID=UPI000404E0BC|nr:hypothetical protein [Microbacterium gubbeenense]
MSPSYFYATQVSARPESDDREWGLYFTKNSLTEDEARARYGRDPRDRENGFIGVVRLADGEDRPRSYLRVGPRANGMELEKLNQHGTVVASYTWRAYAEGEQQETPSTERVFLGTIAYYGYPDEDGFWPLRKSIGSVMTIFRENGYVKEDTNQRAPMGEADAVTTREFEEVDVSVNWFDIPEFGDWEAFFHPEGE